MDARLGMPSFLHRAARPLLNRRHLRQHRCRLPGRLRDRYGEKKLSRGHYLHASPFGLNQDYLNARLATGSSYSRR
jgi:hypothetical protein